MPGPTTTSAPETTIWQGRPSQWTNFPWFLACVLVIPIPFALYHWLRVRCMQYTLTSQRFRIQQGILNRHLDDIELFRVKDITLSQPLIQRLVGLGTVRMVTSDATTPTVLLPAVAEPLQLLDTIRHQVDRVRRERGVRELDVHGDDRSALG